MSSSKTSKLSLKSLTIAICSYQRRRSLLELLGALDSQMALAPDDWEDIDVVVVVDGSTDGSAEAARALPTRLPVSVIFQENSGLSAARNTCLDHAKGELIYFLDDDLIPAQGTVLRHRNAERDREATVVLGPCIIPPDVEAPDNARGWFTTRYEELAGAEIVDRFDRFSIANSSGFTEDFRSVGGFDTSFVGYGLEDYELGLRLMQRGIFERFDGEAIAWHHTVVHNQATVPRNRDTGSNLVRLLRMHPEASSLIFPDHYSGPATWLIDRSHLRSPRVLMRVAFFAQWLAQRVPRRSESLRGTLWALAAAAAQSAGVASLDPSLVPSFLGRPKAPSSGWRWDRVTVRSEGQF